MQRLCLTKFVITQEITRDNVPFTNKELVKRWSHMYHDSRGIRSTLQERGLWKEDLRGKCQKAIGSLCESKSCCAGTLLANQLAFLDQECRIAIIVKAAGHLYLFLPKCHCELNIIKFFWGGGQQLPTSHSKLEGLDRPNREIEANCRKGQGRDDRSVAGIMSDGWKRTKPVQALW